MEKGERRTRKCVLIDEAWELLKSKQAASCLEELFRRGRKFNMASGVVTQSLQDLVETEVGNVILNNSDLRFIFGHKGEALRDARLALTPYEQQIIRSLTMVRGRYSECYITHPSGSGVYRHIIDPVSYWLYTSNAEEVARLQALMEDEQLSMAEAIDRMVGEDTLGKTILANIAEALK
jgi:conjugal transfer ATP-binding protein TraC